MSGQLAIEFNRDHAAGGGQQFARQNTETRSDFNHGFAGLNRGDTGDPFHHIGFDQEVLAQSAARANAKFAEEVQSSFAGASDALSRSSREL